VYKERKIISQLYLQLKQLQRSLAKKDCQIKGEKQQNYIIQASTANATWLPVVGSIFAHLLLATTTPVSGLQENFGGEFRYESVA